MNVDPYSTHQPLLVAAMLATSGPILELGGGNYSTPIVAAFANAQRREAHTVETGPAVYETLKRFATPFHTVWPVAGYDFENTGRFLPRAEMTRADYIAIQTRFLAGFRNPAPQRWGVVFVDHAPGYLRVPAIEHFASSADFIVTHDTEMAEAYGYEPCLSMFAHRWDYRRHPVHATIVSNFHRCDGFAALLGE